MITIQQTTMRVINMDRANIDRYARIAQWASKRYAENGILLISVGGRPSRYSAIENMAWQKYINQNNQGN